MRAPLAVLVSATLGWGTSALAANGDIQITRMTEGGATPVEYLLPLKRAAALPRWEPAQGDPPLSLQRAVEIARSDLERRKLPVSEYRVQFVELSRLLEGPYEHLWYYEVEFLPNPPHLPKPFWATVVIVLMDGSVVSATPIK